MQGRLGRAILVVVLIPCVARVHPYWSMAAQAIQWAASASVQAPDCRTAWAKVPPPGTISRGRRAERRAGMISAMRGARLPPSFTTVTGDFRLSGPWCAWPVISQPLYPLIIKREDTVSFACRLVVFLFFCAWIVSCGAVQII